MSLEKIKLDRLKKLKAIKAADINPYPSKISGSRLLISQAISDFDKIDKTKAKIFLAGRLRAIRSHGGSLFADLEDASGKIQIYIQRDVFGTELYKFFVNNLDVGDFIEVYGFPIITGKGEKTLLVQKEKFQLLAKSLNQLPEKWHGLKDVEERFRKRYLDLLMNKEVRERFKARSQIIKKLRIFFEQEGFIEVETPILQPLPGGALAKPFKTHLNALDMDLYLRVAPELYLKRLLVGGFEKVFEIGRLFRNEGMDKTHNPDFTELEFYWAYADYEKAMELAEKMFGFLVPSKEIEFQGNKINLTPPFKRISIKDLILENYKVDIEKASLKELGRVLSGIGEKPEKDFSRRKMIDELLKNIRPRIIQPTFIINHPIEMSPLAKRLEQNPEESARFQLVIGGMEMVNAYSELNDPQEQTERMKEQEKQRGDEEIQRYDEDFIEALEYGMPPAAGFGLGVDRLVQLLTDAPSLREIILFPIMKEK